MYFYSGIVHSAHRGFFPTGKWRHVVSAPSEIQHFVDGAMDLLRPPYIDWSKGASWARGVHAYRLQQDPNQGFFRRTETRRKSAGQGGC